MAKSIRDALIKAVESRDQRVHDKIASCAATFDRGTGYCDGGADFTHGLSEGSAPCTCGYGRHYAFDGRYHPR